MIFSLYLITNLVNGKRYVGQTVQGLRRRYWHHLKDARRGVERPLPRALRKYGAENFCIKLIETCETKARADDLERRWIRLCNSRVEGRGYNLTDGGEGTPGYKQPPEVRAKHGATLARYWHSPERHHKSAEAKRGSKQTPEAKAEISSSLKKAYAEGRRSRERSLEQRAKIAEGLRQYFATPEGKAKQCAAQQRRWARKRGEI